MKTQNILSIILFILILYAGYTIYLQHAPVAPVPTQVQSIPTSDPAVLSESTKSGELANKTLYKVTKVVDGDTIDIESEQGKQTVRFIGIDTPETVDPRKSVQCFGKEASNETKRLLQGRSVYLEKDVSDTDRYHRLLRYVYLPLDDDSIIFVNDHLVRSGYARLLTYPPDVKFNQQFLLAEQEARSQKKGLWGSCQSSQ
jgi:micrococcal nuclease